MTNTATARRAAIAACQREGVFTLQQARSALKYLSRIVQDAVDAFEQANEARAALAKQSPSCRSELVQQRDEAIARLNRIIDECHGVGATIIDIPRGMLAMHIDDRGLSACVIWRIGEPVETAWRDLAGHTATASPEMYSGSAGGLNLAEIAGQPGKISR